MKKKITINQKEKTTKQLHAITCIDTFISGICDLV